MGPGVFLALLVQGALTSKLPVTPDTVWEETAADQQRKGFHPVLGFGVWDITRFNRNTTYMFTTPKMIQQGQFRLDGTHYYFQALMANEFENADIAKLRSEMNPEAARTLGDNYAKSMANFEADYDTQTETLSVKYPETGLSVFQLHRVNYGDDKLTPSLSDSEKGLAGLWHAAEPFPDKLDANTRYKIGSIEGLRQFGEEASGSEGARLTVLDLRIDKSFRLHDKEGYWQRDGSTITLRKGREETYFTLSADGTKLLSHGKPAFLRN